MVRVKNVYRVAARAHVLNLEDQNLIYALQWHVKWRIMLYCSVRKGLH